MGGQGSGSGDPLMGGDHRMERLQGPWQHLGLNG